MKRDLRIIYMGTPDFAVPSLQKLVEENYQVVAVITAPDKPAGRGLKLRPSPIKTYAVSQSIPVLQPTNLKSPEFLEELKSYEANLQVVVAFRMLPEVVWAMPKYGTFNLHGSLLPQYRGAAPIHWAVINGEKETGLTTFMLKHEIDTGDMLFQLKEPIQIEDTTGDVHDRLMHRGADLVLETVQAIELGEYELKPQNLSGELRKAPKLFKESCRINHQREAEVLYNFIRGLSPFPAAWTIIEGKSCKILKTATIEQQILEGEFVEGENFITDNKKFLWLKASNGYLPVSLLQMQGKKKMGVEDFLRGNKLGENK